MVVLLLRQPVSPDSLLKGFHVFGAFCGKLILRRKLRHAVEDFSSGGVQAEVAHFCKRAVAIFGGREIPGLVGVVVVAIF